MFDNARTEPKVAVNHLGYKQYFGSHGTELCLACKKPYVNEGEGVLCERNHDTVTNFAVAETV